MVQISIAKVSEASKIKSLLNYVWVDTYKDRFSYETRKYIIDERQTIEAFEHELDDSNILFVVAKDEFDSVIGLATSIKEEKRIYLKRLYIHPTYQRTGIGQKLLTKVMSSFEDVGSIYLDAEKYNTRAINFYLKNGFKTIGEEEYEIKGECFSTLLMEKIIER